MTARTRTTAGDVRDALSYIVIPTGALYVAAGLDWRVLLIAPVMWFFGFIHGARSVPGPTGPHEGGGSPRGPAAGLPDSRATTTRSSPGATVPGTAQRRRQYR